MNVVNLLATINKKINSLQSFNNFLMKNNYCNEFVVELRKDRMKVAFGSEKQVEKMLLYIKSGESKPQE